MEIARVCNKKEQRREREAWDRMRWQTMYLLNIAGKQLKHDITDPKQVFRFADERPSPVDPEEQARLAEEHRQFHKEKFWMKLKTDKEGNVKIFNQEDYDRLMKRNNN